MLIVPMMLRISIPKASLLLINVCLEQLIVEGSIMISGRLVLSLVDQHQQVWPQGFAAMIKHVLLIKLTSASKTAILLQNLNLLVLQETATSSTDHRDLMEYQSMNAMAIHKMVTMFTLRGLKIHIQLLVGELLQVAVESNGIIFSEEKKHRQNDQLRK